MRDFFYNKGDIFIAVLIILVAVFVIYLRVSVIMDYSPTGEKGGSILPSVDEIIEEVGDAIGGNQQGNEGTDPVDTTPPPEDNTAAQNGGAATPPQENTPPPQTETPPQEETPPAQQPAEVSITVVAGDAASVIADKLLAAGAITDKQAFLNDVSAQGADSRLKMGTFSIPAGASHSDIIAILTA
jgi:hypothetical protein